MLAVVIRPLLFGLYFVSGLWPRDRRRWVFGSWGGQRFLDNGAALFRYCAELDGAPIEATWISLRASIVRDLRRRGLRAHHAWSPSGLLACLRAGVYVFDGYTKDINHWTSRGAQRVLLRHGVGIKKIERAIDTPSHRLYRLFHGNTLERLVWRFLIPWHDTVLDLVLSTSDEHARQGQAFFEIPRDRIAVTGFARNDVLFDERWEERCHAETLAWIREQQADGHAVFLYMPTFRDDKQSPFPFRWEEFDAGLGAHDVKVLARLHFVDAGGTFADQVAASRNVRLDVASRDPYPLFHAVDGLVNDFSSAAYDFMLTRKPVIFFHPDREAYEAGCRGLYFDYDEVTPGPTPRTLEDLFEAMEGVRRHGLGKMTEAYEKLLDRFHEHQDGRSAERAYRVIYERMVEPARKLTAIEHPGGRERAKARA